MFYFKYNLKDKFSLLFNYIIAKRIEIYLYIGNQVK